MYSVDMKNIIPKESLTCLVSKATLDESMLWHRRLGHVNFKTINKLVKDNLVKGLPIKHFENDQTCVACLKGKQHKASCKSKIQNSITQPFFMLHMNLFGPTFVSSLMNKKYCLVDASNDEPQPSNDAGKKDDEGGIDDQERTKNSAQDINTASTNFNIGSLNINIVSPTVPTAPLES
ncbi:putative ribonuclease H-like domain-containing protein, partial [Tanacetum coccineum]